MLGFFFFDDNFLEGLVESASSQSVLPKISKTNNAFLDQPMDIWVNSPTKLFTFLSNESSLSQRVPHNNAPSSHPRRLIHTTQTQSLQLRGQSWGETEERWYECETDATACMQAYVASRTYVVFLRSGHVSGCKNHYSVFVTVRGSVS